MGASRVSRPASVLDRERVAARHAWSRKAATSRRSSDKRTGINPLWSPKWESIDPSSLTPIASRFYGGPADGPLLAGILGHNLCLDIFGGPSTDELAAGCSTHGEGSVAPYRLVADGTTMTASATLSARAPRFRASHRAARHIRPHHRDRHQPVGIRSADWLDTTRHVRAHRSSRTVSRSIAARPRARRCSSPLRPGRLPRAWRGLRLAPRAAHRRRRRRSPAFQQCRCVQRLHRALDGPVARAGILRRLFSRVRAGGRIRLASPGLSVDGDLGGEPKPAADAVEPRRDRRGGSSLAVHRSPRRAAP